MKPDATTQTSDDPSPPILVTGATGYVGGRFRFRH